MNQNGTRRMTFRFLDFRFSVEGATGLSRDRQKHINCITKCTFRFSRDAINLGARKQIACDVSIRFRSYQNTSQIQESISYFWECSGKYSHSRRVQPLGVCVLAMGTFKTLTGVDWNCRLDGWINEKNFDFSLQLIGLLRELSISLLPTNCCFHLYLETLVHMCIHSLNISGMRNNECLIRKNIRESQFPACARLRAIRGKVWISARIIAISIRCMCVLLNIVFQLAI